MRIITKKTHQTQAPILQPSARYRFVLAASTSPLCSASLAYIGEAIQKLTPESLKSINCIIILTAEAKTIAGIVQIRDVKPQKKKHTAVITIERVRKLSPTG